MYSFWERKLNHRHWKCDVIAMDIYLYCYQSQMRNVISFDIILLSDTASELTPVKDVKFDEVASLLDAQHERDRTGLVVMNQFNIAGISR